MTQPALLECPTCGTPATQVQLGLRDYSRWLNHVLPGKVGGSDVDLALHQQATDRVLFVEFKEANKRLSVGQRLLLTAMVKRKIEVWVAWQYSDGTVRVGVLDDSGDVPFTEKMTEAELGTRVRAWWHKGHGQP